MAKLNPYLNFPGNTEAAFNFYKTVFGGEFLALQRFSATPEKEKLPEADREKIMHIALAVGGNILMGTDALESMGHTLTAGTNFSLSVDAESETEMHRLYNALAEDGQPTMPLAKMFWGAWFGMLTDKFGIKWMINLPDAPAT